MPTCVTLAKALVSTRCDGGNDRPCDVQKRLARESAAGMRAGSAACIGRSILLGLEVLIIADIVQTITIHPTLESALSLALIVLVRTFLSFSLEVELDGVVPWRRACQTGPPSS